MIIVVSYFAVGLGIMLLEFCLNKELCDDDAAPLWIVILWPLAVVVYALVTISKICGLANKKLVHFRKKLLHE